MFIRGLIAFTITFAFMVAAANAQNVRINERIEFYGIQGRTPEQLLREMQAKGPPPAFGGVSYFARAEQYITWDLSFEYEDDVCKMEDVDVNVDMLYVLPKWTDQERGNSRLVRYWEEFEKNVFIHEQGHGNVALEVGKNIAEAMLKITPADTCQRIMDEANLLSREIIKDGNDRQKAYDKQTQHGKTQGAFFDVAAAKGRRRR